MLPPIEAAVSRAKVSGLFPVVSLNHENELPQRLVLTSFDAERFVRLMTVAFDSQHSLLWEVELARGYSLPQKDVAPDHINMPQLLIYVTKDGEKVLGSAINLDATGTKMSAGWAPQNHPAAEGLPKDAPKALNGLDGNDLVLALSAELIAATKRIEVQSTPK